MSLHSWNPKTSFFGGEGGGKATFQESRKYVTDGPTRDKEHSTKGEVVGVENWAAPGKLTMLTARTWKLATQKEKKMPSNHHFSGANC